jgi:hypothetical protein
MGTPGGAPSGSFSTPDFIQVLLAVAVAVGATLGAYCTDRATGERQEQARDQLRRDQAIVEVTRHVYQAEAPRVFLHASACQRAQPTTPAGATPAIQTRLAIEAAATLEAARIWAQASAGSDRLLSTCQAGLAYDPVRRLAELSDAELPPSPEATDPGKAWETLAVLSAVIPVAAALVYLGVLLRRRKQGPATDDLELIEQPWTATGGRLIQVELTIAWALLALLPLAQVALNLEAAQARTAADAQASELYRDLSVGSGVAAFRVTSREQASFQAALGLGRQFMATDTDFAEVALEQQVLGRVQERQGDRTLELAREMGRVPTAVDDLDSAMSRAVASAEESLDEQAAAQIASAESAAALGSRAQRVGVGLLVATLASTLLAVARSSPLQHVRYLQMAAIMLVFSFLFGLTGIVG